MAQKTYRGYSSNGKPFLKNLICPYSVVWRGNAQPSPLFSEPFFQKNGVSSTFIHLVKLERPHTSSHPKWWWKVRVKSPYFSKQTLGWWNHFGQNPPFFRGVFCRDSSTLGLPWRRTWETGNPSPLPLCAEVAWDIGPPESLPCPYHRRGAAPGGRSPESCRRMYIFLHLR